MTNLEKILANPANKEMILNIMAAEIAVNKETGNIIQCVNGDITCEECLFGGRCSAKAKAWLEEEAT